MKKHKLVLLALVALLGFTGAVSSVQAQITYAQDDVLLIFSKTGGAQEFAINLGQANQFVAGGTISNSAQVGGGIYNFTYNVASVSAALTSFYGSSSWYGNANWAVLGVTNVTKNGDTPRTIYSSAPTSTLGGSTPLTESTNSSQGSSQTRIENLYTSLSTASTSGNLSTTFAIGGPGNAAIENTGANSYTNTITIANQYFGNLQSSNIQGTTSQILDLYQLVGGTSFGTVNQLGGFAITSGGQISYDVQTVPEPSTFALLGLGLGSLVALRRLNRSKAVKS